MGNSAEGFGRGGRLLLVAATDFELTPLRQSLADLPGLDFLVCGVGPTATAANLAARLAIGQAKSQTAWAGVILTGVAGAYPDTPAALLVTCLAEQEVLGDFGLESGRGAEPFPPERLPTRQSFELASPLLAAAQKVLTCLEIPFLNGCFVTVNTATTTTVRGLALRDRFGGLCENMEGAAAALACENAGLPLLEIRTVSNLVEDRDPARWRLAEAISRNSEVLARLVPELLRESVAGGRPGRAAGSAASGGMDAHEDADVSETGRMPAECLSVNRRQPVSTIVGSQCRQSSAASADHEQHDRGGRLPPLSLGFSPCPNDTFIFHALVHGQVADAPAFAPVLLEDVETLNTWALAGKLAVTKLSFHALGHVLDRYLLLTAGAALGRGCGPLLVARRPLPPEELPGLRIAIPGKLTTAALLLRLFAPTGAEPVVMRFDRIMPAVAAGEVDAGVIIHESRFTYQQHGLHLVRDLGAWWEETTGHPIPLGGIAVKRELGRERILAVEAAIRQSLRQARQAPERAMPYIRRHAGELADPVIRDHINLYVNDFSLNLGSEGRAAIGEFLLRARSAGIIPAPTNDLPITSAD